MKLSQEAFCEHCWKDLDDCGCFCCIRCGCDMSIVAKNKDLLVDEELLCEICIEFLKKEEDEDVGGGGIFELKNAYFNQVDLKKNVKI